ncbi:MAG: monoheme cytochrome C [Flavobacteriales bacterium]|nr:monoheme cytochrome C [Flavobacteriales bacterium]
MQELSDNEKKVLSDINRKLINLMITLVLFMGGIWLVLYPPSFLQDTTEQAMVNEIDLDLIEDGIHVSSGLVAKEGFEFVQQNCGGCHSYKLVTQNRNTRDGWLETIRWMQETQKLWDLGENEPALLDYLAANYGPEETGRRKQLEIAEWYELE